MTKKLIAFLLVFFLFLSTPLIPASAVAKAGDKCAKAGNTEVVKGKNYTCIKSGKKLVWSKVNVPSSKSDDLAKYEAAKLTAYQNIRNATDSGTADNINFVFHISESFPTDLQDLYTSQYKYAAKLYGTFFTKPVVVNIYMYTEKDSEKIQSDPNLNFNFSDFSPWFKDWKNGQNRNHNIGLASFYVERNGLWQGFAGSAVYSGSSLSSLRKYSIQVQQHEFFHIVQDYYMQSGRGTIFTDQNSYDLLFPPTFREGSTNTISFALASNKFSDYLSLYREFIAEKKFQSSTPVFSTIISEQSVVDALNSIEFRSKNPQAHEASYALGQLLYEYVIAQFGFDSYRKIIENQITVDSFDKNIQKSLGISKAELYRRAAAHILRAFNTN